MARVAFCGIGLMGAHMAGRLLDAGHDLTVWNRTASRTEELHERGATVARTPSEAASSAEVVITMLSDGPVLEDVLFGEDGAAGTMPQDAALIDMSTIGPAAAVDVGKRLGRPMLDAPVIGSIGQARDGSLRILVGGDPDDLAGWLPLLEAMGDVAHVGGPGAGAAMKLVVNSCTASLAGMLGEALAMADRFGLDQAAALDALAATPLATFIERRRPAIESGTYSPAFRLNLAHKDLRLVEEAASRLGIRMQVAAAARDRYAAAEDDGLGELDFGALIAHLRGWRP